MLCTLFALMCPDETVSGYADRNATYHLTELAGAQVPFNATLAFPEEGRVTGRGPCNGFTGNQSAPYPWIAIGPLAVTRMACPSLAQEAAFLAALQEATLVEVQGTAMILSTDADVLMVLETR